MFGLFLCFFCFVFVTAYDVQKRVPDVSKAKEILGVECNTSLEEALDEIIPWIKKQMEIGGI